MKNSMVVGALSLAVAACTSAQSGSAQMLKLGLSDYVQRSQEVAVVQIRRIEPLYSEKSPKVSCGYLYDAVVEQHIKGTKKSFRFYSDAGNNYLGDRYEYLVIAVPFLTPKMSFETPRADSKASCRSRVAARYWVPWNPPLIAPVQTENSVKWILTSRFSLLFLKVFGAKKTYIDMHCYAEMPLHKALDLIAAAEHGHGVVDTYLRKRYPTNEPYYLLADPCRWEPQSEKNSD